MPGLNPLMNAQPRQQIPNEAPSYFSPFFEQTPRPPPVAIWQPPKVEASRRSKVPINVPRTPLNIPSAGARHPDSKPPVQKQTLFQPRAKKKSLEDDIMWLGQVSGFTTRPRAPSPPNPEDQKFVRSRLSRKPEEKASQASAMTGPRALEEKKRQEEEERDRERRLEEWATKRKKKQASLDKEEEEKKKKKHPSGDEPSNLPPGEWLPQPVESSSKSTRPTSRRGKIFVPQPQLVETVSFKHRPNLPQNDISFAPSNPILPQPIETVRRSNRPPKAEKKEPEEQVWMGMDLPQPIETSRRSNRKSPLRAVESPEDHPSARHATEKDSDHLQVPHTNETTGRLDPPSPKLPEKKDASVQLLPQPIETTKRSNRSPKAEVLPQPIETTRRSNRPAENKTPLPQPIETTRRSNRPAENKTLLPQPIETTHRSNRPQKLEQKPKENLPQPVETTRRTNRPVSRVERRKEILPEPIATTWKSNRLFFPQPYETSWRSSRQKEEGGVGPLPQPIETTRRSNRPAEILPQPIETSRRSNRPGVSPLQQIAEGSSPPTPTTSFFGPDIPQKSEGFARHPAQPLIPSPIEPSRRTHMKHGPDMHIELPQPISVSRWSSKKDGRRQSTLRSARTPDERPRDRNGKLEKKQWAIPEDHFSHLHEPVDSLPGSPEDSPEEDNSPESSKCPSLSSSLTSTTSSLWDGKGGASHGTSQHVENAGPVPTAKREAKPEEYPFPEVPKDAKRKSDNLSDFEREPKQGRSDTSETVRPPLKTFISDPTGHTSQENDDYPICHSPTYEKFDPFATIKRPQPPATPAPDEEPDQKRQGEHGSRISTADLTHTDGDIAIRIEAPPTPPDSHASSFVSRQRSFHSQGRPGTAPNLTMYRGMGASPGYTVASLPPKRKREDTRAEVTDEFVDEVCRYLSLGWENIARKFDAELAEYTGLTVEEVRQDRKRAVKLYCTYWVQEHPNIEAGEHSKGGLW